MTLVSMMNEMSIWLRFVLAVLATWRITHLLATEDGPGALLFRLRVQLGSTFVGKLMDCFLCLSFWVAAPLALLVTHQLLGWLVAWFALSGAACLLERMKPEPIVIRQLESEGDKSYALLRSEERQPEKQRFSPHQ